MSLPHRSSGDDTKRREALEELIGTEGWRIYTAHCAREWAGQGYVTRMRTALGSGDIVDSRVVDRTALEIVRLLQWPQDQVGSLKGVEE